MNIRFTCFTSTFPSRLTKEWRLDECGQPVKIAGGQMVKGSAQVISVSSFEEFAALLQTLTPAQALTYGIPPIEAGQAMTRKAWLAESVAVNYLVCASKPA